MLEFFGVDFLDLWRGRLSLRRIGVLVQSLLMKPGRSTLLMAMDERARWAERDYLLARVSDALELSNYLFLKANVSENDARDLEFPSPIPRPGESEPQQPEAQPEFSNAQELSTFLGRINSL
ncbi:hypothetical protein [Streptomyces antarcticus]|uniref:hypothetical protein n=1 Tax=Streptomyces antarcticus TaxID=2996458 RepID=UPI0022718043|nr:MULTISPECIES: hypothetical protein [unclassified Streptomyces]MCY0941912.1 hypothetical protein [Streptomyces sp. H34-AA3]MCZ4082815.1 hypothetical protein [Streptomyces sp. H34-S5]